MKKRSIIFFAFVFLIGIVAITFAWPAIFSVSKINLMKDSKVNEIMKKLDNQYYIDEPKLVLTADEESIIENAISAVSVITGLPNKEIDHSYWAYKSRLVKLQNEYGYDNEDLPTDVNGEIEYFYRYYKLEEESTSIANSKQKQYEYEVERFEEINLQKYNKIRVKSIYSYDDIKYTVSLVITGGEILKKSVKTGAFEKVKGDIIFNVIMLKSNNKFKLLDFYTTEDTNVGEAILNTDKSEINNLDGEFSYNLIEGREYTPEEIKSINMIYQDNKDSIVSLSTINKNNTITSNSTGFFVAEGIVLTNWTWFEEYLIGEDEIIVSDINNKIYFIDGIISISKYYDIVILKLTEKVGKPIENYGYLSMFDEKLVFALTSPSGIGVSTNIGVTINSEAQIHKTNLTISESEVGAPVFDEIGRLVAITTAKQINSTISYSTNILKISYILYRIKIADFDNILIYGLNEVKNNMYFNKVSALEDEKDLTKYNIKIYDKFMNEFDIKEIYEDSISKISTIDDYLVVRVNYNKTSMISKKQYLNLYAVKLYELGYQEVYSDMYKKVFKNDKYSITFNFETWYISIVYREV